MKKVLSFVLVLALVLGSFSMAFAAPVTDVDGNANETAITVVNDLGIVTGYDDGTFLPEKAVNRAEFAAMIVRALDIPDSALAGYTATSFKDTTGYGWAVPYLAFCQDKGIMLGDGQGNVMPGRTINMNEAVTMALRAIGLTDNAANLTGSWPANYVTVAKSVGLYDDVAAITTVDRANAAQIIYNLLTVPGYAVDNEGGIARTATLMGALTSRTVTNVAIGLDSASKIDLFEYIGAWGTTYVNSKNQILAFEADTTFLTGEFEDAYTFVTTDDVEYDVTGTTSGAYYYVNGVQNGTTDAAASLGEVTIAVNDISGKKIDDIKSIITWVVNADAQVDADDLEAIEDDSELLSASFALDDNDDIDTSVFQLLGAKTLADIAKDDVVYVYTANLGDGAVIVKIEVANATVTGKVTKEDSDGKLTINGTKYSKVDASINTVTIAVGDEGTAILDYAGNIYDFDKTSGAVDNYAVVVSTKTATDWNITTNQIKLFTKEGNEITPALDEDKVTSAQAFGQAGKIVSYGLNKDGEVDSLTTFTAVEFSSGTAVATDLIGTAKVAKDVVVFLFDGTDYEIGTMADIQEKLTTTLSAVKNSDGNIAAILVTAANQGNEDADYGIITATGASISTDDGTKAVVDFIIGTDVKTDVIDKVSGGVNAISTTSASTALYKLTINESGELTSASAIASGVTAAATVTSVDGNLITVTNGGISATYKIADDVIVYIYDTDTEKWSIGKTSQLEKKTAVLYNTDTDDDAAEYVVAW